MSSSTPSARSTYDGSSEAEVQAEPPSHRHVLDRHHQGLALDVGEGHVQVAGQPVLERAVEDTMSSSAMSFARSRSRSASMRADSAAISVRAISAALPKPDDAGDVQGARAHAPLVAAAVDDRGDAHPRLRGGRTARRCPWARRSCAR